MLHSLKHYKVLHERMVIVTIRIFDVPYVEVQAGRAARRAGVRTAR
jgi:K+ transporter